MGPSITNSSFQTAQPDPGGFPLAPENDDFPEEIRQMILDRYRVLFTIRKHKVHLLHVRGANIRGSA